MAIKKTITDNKGVVSNYHKVKNYKADNKIHRRKNGEDITEGYIINVKVASYVSEEKREVDEALNCGEMFFSLSATTEELNTLPILSLIYAKLKESKIFEGAEDC